MTRRIEADVVVVGAGLAGLVAARRLAAAGCEVAVLEARPRVGGRTLNADLGDGKVVELGGQWIGPTQDHVAALAGELGVHTFPTHDEGDNLLEMDGRLRRYGGTVPRLGPHVLVDLEVARRRLARVQRRVRAEVPWEARGAAELDGETLGGWLRRHTRTRAARRLVALAAKTVWGAEPDELSLLHALATMRSAGGFDMMIEVSGGAQQDRFRGGSQLLSLRIAEELGAQVHLAAPVRRLEQRPDAVIAQAGELAVTARRAVVAVPANLAGRIAFEPPLTAIRDGLHQRAYGGALVKCMAVYDEPFWREDGLSGEAVSEAGPATLVFDNSPPDGRPGVLLGFVGGAEARAFADPQARRRAVTAAFRRLFGPSAERPGAWLEQSWHEEPWSGGGPNCLFPPGTWTAHGRAVRAPLGRLHWAGAETAERWWGYLDGAVSSGERAAEEVLAAQD